MKTALLVTALAAISVSPAAADPFSDGYNTAVMGYALGGGFDPPPQRFACGPMGLGSYGSCRMGIIGALDQQTHGACMIDPRTLATRCQR